MKMQIDSLIIMHTKKTTVIPVSEIGEDVSTVILGFEITLVSKNSVALAK